MADLAPGPHPERATPTLRAAMRAALPVLRELVIRVEAGQTLVVASLPTGLPVALARIDPAPQLPRGLVIGRHLRCTLPIVDDPSVSLRHVLLAISSGAGTLGVRLRAYDLGGRGGIFHGDGRRIGGLAAWGQLAFGVGESLICALPGAEAGRALLEGDEDPVCDRILGGARDAQGRGDLGAQVEPEIAQIGGYRAEPAVASEPRGALRLRATKPTRDAKDQRSLPVQAEELRRGLLIGRYSDRCSIAGSGRNLSRVHALVTAESEASLLVYDLASTNGVRPADDPNGPSREVVRLTPDAPCLLGHFELSWHPEAID